MTYRQLGGLICDARKEKGLTQEQLADAIGTSRTHINRWEKGQHAPGPEYLRPLADELGLDVGLLRAIAATEKTLAATQNVLAAVPALEVQLQDLLGDARPSRGRSARRSGP